MTYYYSEWIQTYRDKGRWQIEERDKGDDAHDDRLSVQVHAQLLGLVCCLALKMLDKLCIGYFG